ncbi:hypothetical protein AWC31_23485 [Mycolicibacterium wolinskyi]|uniref:Uncharacterized protein n=2 Tax=Mycobacteriaceae TaxID=1762 RepID=A0A1X2FAR5_9MYCO|nr:hypothetical protein AWC31_23485 [Mycolicibacterium wolinskyi]
MFSEQSSEFEFHAAPTRPAPVVAPRGTAMVLVPVVVGAAVAVALGVFGRVHEPQFFSVSVAGFSSGTAVKSWLATLAVTLAVFQLVSAFVMYRLTPSGRAPSWIAPAHVWSGRLAVLASVPVAVHCLYALGFQSGDSRVFFHSLFGCFFYGVFVTKMMLLTRKNLRPWVIPIIGGLLFFVLVYVWLTSALWFFETTGLTF